MVRKTVTLVFCDVQDSTPLGEQLDPEVLRSVWSSYHETAREVLESHGATIEKFVGDAVMAVFGIPLVHEDDALRAVRAAVELRQAIAGLNDRLEDAYGVRIKVRTGVNTGEVIAGDPEQGQAFATGDPVVVAQRLEAAAAGGEILVADSTIQLVRDAVTVQPVPPLELKGKSEPVAAWRLIDVDRGAAGVARRMDSPLVGRVTELTLLKEELERATTERTCRVVTILGEPGVGKSRLAAELVTSAGESVVALEGKCLPYGNGITYWPLVEIVRRLDLADLLAGEEDGETIHSRILEAIGRAEPRSRSDELYWAVRRLLETLARERPVVLLLDDVQWAEPAFLDLVEYLAGWCRDAPILVCCMARPDLAELRPAWAAGLSTIQLAPLGRDESRQLLEQLAGPLDEEAADAVGRATAGNPLFLEEMLRMLIEDGVLVERDGRLQPLTAVDSLRVPGTVQAVLAARLDLLEPEELAVLQRAAVMGQVFLWGAVAELTPAEQVGEVSRRLQALVRKQLIRPDRRSFVGEDGFRFGHILIRDAAYESMPKQVRAALHEQFAGWVETRVGERTDLDEIIGHHLEQAYRYRIELRPAGRAESELATRAALPLTRAGRRALTRGDASAAIGLLERAIALETAPDLLLDLAEAQVQQGQVREAEESYRAAIEAAVAADNVRCALRGRLGLGQIALLSRGDVRVEDLADEVARALPEFEAAGDDATVARLMAQLAVAYWWRCQTVAMQDALERALVHARRAGDERLAADVAVYFGFAAVIGPLPVAEGRRFITRTVEDMLEDTSSKGMLLLTAAVLAAMAADFDEARRLAARGTEILDALGRSVGLAAISTWTSMIDLLAGDAQTAEETLRGALEQLEAAGQRANLASVAAQLAETLVAAGRYDDAARYAAMSERAAAPDDLHAQIAWRVARAKASAGLGAARRAEAVAQEAIDLAAKTDSTFLMADALEAFASAAEADGRSAEAATAAAEALQLYEAKGNVAAAARVSGRWAGRTASTRG
jgi:class 3 adenylate cyclase/tetratricopeptide (TPR) repeat protein